MIDKLKENIIYFDDLEKQMIDPSLINNQNKYKEVTREHRRLIPIIEKSKIYISIYDQIDEDESILKGDDDELKNIVKDELDDLKAEANQIEEELKILLLPHDPNDDKNIILEIRAGTGGDEAALFAADLYRVYSRFAERNKWQYKVMESNPIGIGGYKELIMSISGDGAYGMLKFESGVHRVQRVPKTETSGRVHTSAATVAVLPEAEEADIQLVDADLKIDTYRA
ncbi:MAG: PCRF domain-containing protein, partial [Candidatus Marinimicrobia bacterium]|nr:PCRF domain-containing protein [Candidatus Neomarinimicrobiota bacterium]